MTIELGKQAIDALNALRDQAKARNISLDAYLQHLAHSGGNGTAESNVSMTELELYLDELVAGPALPVLPADFSRPHIYTEHD